MEAEERQNSAIEPRTNTYLLGHAEEEQIFLNAWKNRTLHNSWLLCGIEGIGKATLAFRFARFLLAADERQRDKYGSLDVSVDSQTYKLVANASHPDLKVIERDFTETDKKKVLKAIKEGERLSDEELKSLKKSAIIKVDDVRTINEFLAKKSSNDGWRVVIVDSIDDLNNAGANAILKILEEPPAKTVIMLISHNPNRLLPTIRSRCAKMNLKPLAENEVASLMRRYRPELSEKAVKGLAELSSGSVGKAIRYADNAALASYDDLCKIIYAKNKYKLADLLAFCDAAVADEDSYNLVQELVLKFVAENVKGCENVEELAEMWEKAVRIFDETARLNLDKKQALINIISGICKVI